MRITVIGANGFVGSAFVRHLRFRRHDVLEVTRANYAKVAGTESEVVVEAACNSKKFWAEERPFEEFDASVAHRVRTLRDFPANLHVHLSSGDVYNDFSSPVSTREASVAIGMGSNYGFHKALAESVVRRHAHRWLILRLAGMVGPGLKKNPVYDIVNDVPIRIHPESKYQFMATDEVACVAADLIDAGAEGEIFNVCGNGLISPREIAAMAGCELRTELVPGNAVPRIVDIDLSKIEDLRPMQNTREAVAAFIDQRRGVS